MGAWARRSRTMPLHGLFIVALGVVVVFENNGRNAGVDGARMEIDLGPEEASRGDGD